MMSEPQGYRSASESTRRSFLKASTVAAAGAAMAGSLSLGRSVHAGSSDVLRIGLIGCGGRGTGAAVNALTADKNTKLVAMADLFQHRLDSSYSAIKGQESVAKQFDVSKDRCFVGFDAYKQLIATDCDIVILGEVPHFRPQHLKAAIEAGKHVFCEKPVAVDAAGYKSILETTKLAEEKKLSLVSGLCWRYDYGVRETMKRIMDGSIGDLTSIQVTYNTGYVGGLDRDPKWSEMEYQLRNWQVFTWLSGDHNNEQHIHSVDKAAWAMHDEPPVRAWGLGGRQVRVESKYGNIFDHHAVVYEYANGVNVYSFCRQQMGCWNDTTDNFYGTKGRGNVLNGFTVKSGKKTWKYKGDRPNMYEVEHKELIDSIRNAKPINNGRYMANSTMMTVLGRMVTYTGQAITWEEAINSKEVLAPKEYSFAAEPPIKPGADGKYPIAMPGLTKFV
jgi:predicted dehydrogenase